MDRAFGFRAVDVVLGRERVECILAAERQHQLFARDTELTGDVVDSRRRDPLDGLPESLGLRQRTRLAGIRDRRRLEGASAERDVGDDHGGDEPECDEDRDEAPHACRLRTNASGTNAPRVRTAASRNGPENALVTARFS